jgi:hypothetical protein
MKSMAGAFGAGVPVKAESVSTLWPAWCGVAPGWCFRLGPTVEGAPAVPVLGDARGGRPSTPYRLTAAGQGSRRAAVQSVFT